MAREPTANQEIRELPVASLVPHERNGVFRQMTDEEVAELAASVAERGFIHPLVVRPVGEDRYQVLSGHQRLRAAQRLGLATVPCRVVEVDDREAELLLLDANLEARQLGPMELARAIRRKKELLEELRAERRRQGGQGVQDEHLDLVGKTRDLLADQFGISPVQVYRYDALNDLIPELQALVDAGALGVTAGAGLAKLPAEVQRQLWEALGDAVGQIRVDEVRRLREDGERAGIVVAALTRQVEELQARLQEREGTGQEAEELRQEIAKLQERKRALELDIQDRLALRKQLERKPGARLLELVTEMARTVGRARPELEGLIGRLHVTGLDEATAANLQPYVVLFREITGLLEEAAALMPSPSRLKAAK